MEFIPSNLITSPWVRRVRWFRSIISVFGASVTVLLLQVSFSAVPLAGDFGAGKSRQPSSTARLQDFRIVRPRFIVRGTQLSKVEIWISSTGTGLEGPGLLGTATRIGEGKLTETWALAIPRDLLVVEIFAIAFDKNGKVVGKRSLPYRGASALNEALYGKK